MKNDSKGMQSTRSRSDTVQVLGTQVLPRSVQPCTLGSVIGSILQVKKLRLPDAKGLAAGDWQG